MKIALGCDHGGYDYKEIIKQHLINKGYEVIDCGTFSKDSCKKLQIMKQMKGFLFVVVAKA